MQNFYFQSWGRFTGQLAGKMGQDIGSSWVILRHVERRHLFNESDYIIGPKSKHFLVNTNVNISECIREHFEEQDLLKIKKVCASQMK